MRRPSKPSPSETDALLSVYRASPSRENAARVIEKCEPMIRMAASRISRNRPDLYEDLHQVGRLALFRLLGRYDAAAGAQFETYAMKSMVGHMKNYLRDKSWYIQVPRRIKEKGIHVRQTIDELTAQLGRSPSAEEIAERLGLTRDETLEVLTGRDMYRCVSLDTPVFDDESLSTLGDRIGQPRDEFTEVESRLDLELAMKRLKPEEAEVIRLVFVFGLPQRAVAERLGVSQMSVSRMQRRAIGKLRRWMSDNLRGGEYR
jgi:RNA polymerase sigma-B factor